jgi:hypothetical protein
MVCLEMSPDIIKNPAPQVDGPLFARPVPGALGHAPEPFVVTVAMASVIAFLSRQVITGTSWFMVPAATISCESRHTLNGDLCADCGSACATPLARIIEPQENRSTKACTYQVRSTCHLTNVGSGTKLPTLTKMDGRLYSLAPNTWFSAGEGSTPRLSTVQVA